MTHFMKFILDFFPILLFFGAYKMADIYTATAVLMGATVVQTAIMYKMDGKLQTCTRSRWFWCWVLVP